MKEEDPAQERERAVTTPGRVFPDDGREVGGAHTGGLWAPEKGWVQLAHPGEAQQSGQEVVTATTAATQALQ